MSEPSSWKDLRDKFLGALLQQEDSERMWLEIWRLLVQHPWYQAELRCCAQRVLWRGRAPLAWQKEVEHDAMLVLARELRHAPDLGLDYARAEDEFAAWLGTIIRRDCQQALRRLRRVYRPGEALPEDLPEGHDGNRREVWIDIQAAVNHLNDPARTVVALYSKGLSVRQIAAELELSYWPVYRALRRGLEELRRLLSQ